LHLHDAAGETQPLQLAVEHRAVKADFGRAPLDKGREPIKLARPALRLPRLPGAQPEPALDGLAIHPQFTRDCFDPFAPVLARDHLAHQVRS
jgi:hypothetical protein